MTESAIKSSLENKVALITGAGQGIGQGIAFALAKRGAKIAALGRTLAKCEETCKIIQQRFGTETIALGGDVSQLDGLKSTVESVVEALGPVDILVNNAVSTSRGPLLSQKDEHVLHAFTVGPLATLKLMQLCHPHMVSRGGGSIINLASSAAKRWDMSGYGVYAAEKEAIRTLTRTAASEWGKDNIRANCILPHAKSPALKAWTEQNPQEAAAFVRSIPLQRIGECEEDIGEFVAMLCSDEAAYVSGQSIAVDGGQAYMG